MSRLLSRSQSGRRTKASNSRDARELAKSEIDALRKALQRAEQRLQQDCEQQEHHRRSHERRKYREHHRRQRAASGSGSASRSASRANSRNSSLRASRRNSGRERMHGSRESSHRISSPAAAASNEESSESENNSGAALVMRDVADVSALALDKRFAHAITQTDSDRERRVYICRDAEHGNTLCIKKVGFSSDWRTRICRETAVHRRLQRIAGFEKHIVALLAAWHLQNSHSVLVTPLVQLGPLDDTLTERSVEIDSVRVQRWLDSSSAALRWLHRCAMHVHCNALLGCWLLQTADHVVLADFDRCWARDDFFDRRNFDTFCRYDQVVLLDELQRAVRIEHERDVAMARANDNVDDQCVHVNWHACNQAIAEHSKSNTYYSYALERAALRAQVMGSEEERSEMAHFDAFEIGSESSGSGSGSGGTIAYNDASTKRALRQQLARNFSKLHLRMADSAPFVLEY